MTAAMRRTSRTAAPAPDGIVLAQRAMGLCLRAPGVEIAAALSWLLRDHAPPDGQIALACAALDALPEDLLMEVVDRYTTAAGWPLPPFGALAREARDWAAIASAAERKFYAWASIEKLGDEDLRAFREAAGELLTARGVPD